MLTSHSAPYITTLSATPEAALRQQRISTTPLLTMSRMEEELVRAEVRLQDVKRTDAGGASSGVTGGIMGAIRKTSDAFANSFHMMTGSGQQNQAHSDAALPSNDAPSSDQQKERRMSDIEHLWQSSRQIHGF